MKTVRIKKFGRDLVKGDIILGYHGVSLFTRPQRITAVEPYTNPHLAEGSLIVRLVPGLDSAVSGDSCVWVAA